MSLHRKARRLPVLFLAIASMLTGMSCVKTPPSSAPPVATAEGKNAVPTSDGETFLVKLETTKGDIVIEVHPAWAPLGAARFRELVESDFYAQCAFFRVLPDFMCQVGMNGNPEIHARWSSNTIMDDPVIKSNTRGYVTFAKTNAPNSRSTQFFINYADRNAFLDSDGFAPFGIVIEGLDVADSISSQYGETPDQNRIRYEGNAYLKQSFPGLDYIVKASIISGNASATEPASAEADATDSASTPPSQEGDAAAESVEVEAPAAAPVDSEPVAAESK